MGLKTFNNIRISLKQLQLAKFSREIKNILTQKAY